MIAVVNLIGRLGGDPQQKKSQKGTDYLTFTLAVDHGYGDNRRTDWYSCIAFDKVCERILKMKVAKGSMAHVIGALELEQYERKDGSKGMGAKVTLYDVEYVSGGGKKDAQAVAATQPTTVAGNAAAPSSGKDGDFENIPLDGDALPF